MPSCWRGCINGKIVPVDSGSTGHPSAGSTSESTASVGSTSSAGNNTKPTSANTVADIKAYLDAHNISYASNLTKDQLLALVK
ncbi:hypothetical protein EFE22_08180 [Lactobacillus delbrueckii subsp. lactis]|uniref:HeH/LEM domain-containing protein n=1 Tax=Lactobacillus delbrueckii TaxID=1584 RepID=UPI00288023AC|nr:HeH/LEM domain-containing protein [Lactobacillus delbrueckii]MCS8615735.1 hypothetical protein [Lactobacillus delbrueckii subsp. lactis]